VTTTDAVLTVNAGYDPIRNASSTSVGVAVSLAAMDFDGKFILSTGGTSGMGFATARTLLDRGASVAITGRDPSRLDAAARRLDAADKLLTIHADASARRRRWPGRHRVGVAHQRLMHLGKSTCAIVLSANAFLAATT
jgi:NAD(P)-dependent dehydrogenase (short-subunit alcohol dehydrogenase family)